MALCERCPIYFWKIISFIHTQLLIDYESPKRWPSIKSTGLICDNEFMQMGCPDRDGPSDADSFILKPFDDSWNIPDFRWKSINPVRIDSRSRPFAVNHPSRTTQSTIHRNYKFPEKHLYIKLIHPTNQNHPLSEGTIDVLQQTL